MQAISNKTVTARTALTGILIAAVLTGCGGGGGGGGGTVAPPLMADPTFSITLESVEATDRSSGNAVTASGNPVAGATATLQ